jgi:hypothetical protein
MGTLQQGAVSGSIGQAADVDAITASDNDVVNNAPQLSGLVSAGLSLAAGFSSTTSNATSNQTATTGDASNFGVSGLDNNTVIT